MLLNLICWCLIHRSPELEAWNAGLIFQCILCDNIGLVYFCIKWYVHADGRMGQAHDVECCRFEVVNL